jgi:hypothetical protein
MNDVKTCQNDINFLFYGLQFFILFMFYIFVLLLAHLRDTTFTNANKKNTNIQFVKIIKGMGSCAMIINHFSTKTYNARSYGHKNHQQNQQFPYV